MEKRKQYFIDKKFQTNFILKFCAINILASVLFGALIYALNRETNTVAFENLRVVVKSTSDFILPITLQVILTVSVVVAFATIVIVLLMSHRISGPIYGLTNQLRAIRQGNLAKPVRIRTTDQLQQLSAEIEELRADLQKMVLAWKECTSMIEKTSGSGAPRSEDWKAIQDRAASIKSQLEQFKTA